MIWYLNYNKLTTYLQVSHKYFYMIQFYKNISNCFYLAPLLLFFFDLLDFSCFSLALIFLISSLLRIMSYFIFLDFITCFVLDHQMVIGQKTLYFWSFWCFSFSWKASGFANEKVNLKFTRIIIQRKICLVWKDFERITQSSVALRFFQQSYSFGSLIN